MAMASETPNLTATYASPANEPFALAKAIPAPPTAALADKTQFLRAVRQAVDDAQALVNRGLTERMREDGARDAAAAAELDVDEAKAEENYGEEEVSDQE